MDVIKELQLGASPFPWEYLHDSSITEKFGKWLELVTKSSLGH